MSFGPDFFRHLATQGDALHARVLSRDDAHLAPTSLTKAAGARLRRGIAALESWLRRVLILMALTLEPDLVPSQRPWVKTNRPPLWTRGKGLRVFQGGEDPPRGLFDDLRWNKSRREPSREVWAAPLLERLSALKALIDAPEKRARRLAFHLARTRPGRLRAPSHGGRTTGWLFGTEAGTLFDAMAAAIWERSRARPPPLGPALRAPPRVRTL